MSTLATVARNSSDTSLQQKLIFQSDILYHDYVTIADADMKSPKSLSIHYLRSIWTMHMLVKFEQNRIFRTKQSFKIYVKKGLSFLSRRHFGRCFCD